MFTACQKETLLETNQTTHPTQINAVKTNSSDQINDSENDEALIATYALDATDSAAIAAVFLKAAKNTNNAATACYNNTPNPNQCGNSFRYSSCQYALEIWNDPANLYLDFDFSSQLVGTRTDCYGRRCNYWLVPYIQLHLYNANGAEIGVVNLSTANISTRSKTFTINIAGLAAYGDVACVSLTGYFKALKQCSGGCNGSYGAVQCVGTFCIGNNACQRFCLQVCPPPPNTCPTVSAANLSDYSFCTSGNVTGHVNIVGDASKTNIIWTSGSQTFTGNDVTIPIASNNSCSPENRTIKVTVYCTTDNSILYQQDLKVTVNPTVTSSLSIDNISCFGKINFSCPDITAVSWTLGNVSGTGTEIPLNTQGESLNYSYSAYGCEYTQEVLDVKCLLLLKNTPKGSHSSVK